MLKAHGISFYSFCYLYSKDTLKEDYTDSPGFQWQTPSRSTINPTISIVSPGYNSAHALQLEFPAANVTSWFFLQAIPIQIGVTWTSAPPTALSHIQESTTQPTLQAGNITLSSVQRGRLATQPWL